MDPARDGAPPGVVKPLQDLRVKVFADGAELALLAELARNPLVSGFTTNPTLMRCAGVPAYESFAKKALKIVGDRPISFEVLADDFDEMWRQAVELASWGPTVYVKIPITNTSGKSSCGLIRDLTQAGVRVNVTAVLTLDQVAEAVEALQGGAPSVVSVFAGRVADTGVDPVPHMAEALTMVRRSQGVELLWASPRELLNVFQADRVGCDIITVTNDVLSKLPLVGKDLATVSLETVKMFYRDATSAGYTIKTSGRPRPT
ncbi:transaldolase [Planctomycetota bacterium]